MQLCTGIEEFVKVVENGSFARAATTMGLSKSHMSKHVKKLEDRLGVTLIHRTTRQLKLTNHGQEFFIKCQTILHDLEEAQASLANDVATPRGHIRLTVAGAFGEDYISPIVAKFLQEYTDVSIDMTFSNRMVDLIEEQYDLAIRSFSGMDHDSSQRAERLISYRLITVAAQDYIDKHGKPKTIGDLKSHNCLGGTLPYWRFQSGGRSKEVLIHGNWNCNNGRALVHAAKSGLGIIQLPDFYIKHELANGELIEVFDTQKITKNSFWAIYPKSHHIPIKSQMLVQYIQDSLGFNP